MFHLYDFLIYCFITAYTPGANNLLSMSNAIRLGLRRSIRFNLGILAGFAIVMSVCTAFSATLYSFLPKVKIVMQILGAAYMLYLVRRPAFFQAWYCNLPIPKFIFTQSRQCRFISCRFIIQEQR